MRRLASGGVGQARRIRLVGVVGAVVGLAALAGCTAGSGGSGGGARTSGVGNEHSTGSSPAAPGSSHSSAAPPAGPAVISTSPALTGAAVNPAKQVSLAIANGRLTDVTMTNPAGKKVTGALATDGSSWHTTEALGYSKTYQITATGVSASGAPVVKHESLTTLTPGNMTMPYLQRIGGYSLQSGATFGIGIVPIVHFDEHITDEAAAQRALSITTSPQVAGSWYWSDDQDAHWRPESFWAPGTKVTIAANVYGVEVGKGLYGQSDVSASFTIGASQITVADDNAPQGVDKVYVYHSGKLVRTMNTSMGQHDGEWVNGQHIDFHTMVGTYTVLEHDNPAIMSSASYGLPANAPGGYAPEPIYYSTKISTDGVYLHYLDTIYAQDHGEDVSHGCLNLDHANAVWFFNTSNIGDPVEIQHTDGPTITVQQGGDWSVPWSSWLKGSALAA